MEISLLNLKDRKVHAEKLPERVLYHLSLDRSFSCICSDEGRCKVFLSVVSALTDDEEEVLYRQEIVKDFENHPALLAQMIQIASRFEQLRIEQKAVGRDKFRLNFTGNASSDSLKNILQTQALCLKRSLCYVKEYSELLGEYELKSKGLTDLYSACKEICENPNFESLLAFCSKYESFTTGHFWNFRFSLSSEGRIKEYALIDYKYIHITDPESKEKRFPFFKKTEKTPVHPCVRLTLPQNDLFERLTIAALSDLSGLFGSISEQIFAKFATIGRELPFYDVALAYINEVTNKHVPICYPVISKTQSIKVKKLYDLYLLMSKTIHVTPNDFMLEQGNSGLLVFGQNGSGKTVYLRSIGTMQILAQAGLPIPCESAEIMLFSQLTTQFSEAEKEFCEGNDAGRFEQEVRELAAMVDTLKEGALVFLNETFQSTAYAEGAEGLYYLLKHFSALNIRWILVSHLKQLAEMFENNEVTILHTENGYRISK